MTDAAERELSALIVREQRGFRIMMYFGVFLMIVIGLMSVGMGLYYSRTQAEIARAVAKQQFDARRADQRTINAITNQAIDIRRISDELRRMSGAGAGGPGDALAAARVYLERGQRSLSGERAVEIALQGEDAQGPQRALLEGVAHLLAFDRSGGGVQAGDEALPPRLQEALAAFERAKNDPELGPLAQIGRALVLFNEAQRVSYTQEACDALFQAVVASAGAGGALAPRPLYWRANCERKLGQTPEALRDYAAMLTQSAAAAADADADHADLDLAMNAFHGVGTTLIALNGARADDANVQAGLAVAARECPQQSQDGGSAQMRLAIACLSQAMALRRRMGQNPSQVAGTGENLGFAYLRDNDFPGALDHANRTAGDTLAAWNELVRALAAERIAAAAEGEDADAAREIARQARSNISFFTPPQFDLCEVRRLLSPELYREAVAIVRDEHRNEEIPCEA